MAHETNTANAYLRTKVLTAPPEQLRLMLLDGAIRFAAQGREALGRKDFEGIYNGISQCRNIVFELMSSIGPDVDPTLAHRVRALYTYIYSRLLEASTERSAPKLDEAIELLTFERHTWALFLDRLAAERAGTLGTTAPATTTPAATAAAPTPAAASFSLSA